MGKPLPFTEHSLRRAIRGVESAGKFVVGVRPDGTLIVGDKPVDTTQFAEFKGTGVVDAAEAARASSWSDFQ